MDVDAFVKDLTLRQSLLVAVGDLLFRHPNVVEPWCLGLTELRQAHGPIEKKQPHAHRFE